MKIKQQQKSRYQWKEGGGWSSVGGGYDKKFPRDTVRPLFCLQCWHGLTPPRTLHPNPLLLPMRQMRAPRGILTYPSLPEWQFLTTMNSMMTTMTKIKKSKEETSWSKRLDNQTHDVITQYRVGYVDLTAMVTVTKKHLHCQFKWGSLYQGFFSVKFFWNRNQISWI